MRLEVAGIWSLNGQKYFKSRFLCISENFLIESYGIKQELGLSDSVKESLECNRQ